MRKDARQDKQIEHEFRMTEIKIKLEMEMELKKLQVEADKRRDERADAARRRMDDELKSKRDMEMSYELAWRSGARSPQSPRYSSQKEYLDRRDLAISERRPPRYMLEAPSRDRSRDQSHSALAPGPLLTGDEDH